MATAENDSSLVVPVDPDKQNPARGGVYSGQFSKYSEGQTKWWRGHPSFIYRIILIQYK